MEYSGGGVDRWMDQKLMTFCSKSRPNVNITTERDRLFGLYKLFPVLKYWDFHEKTVYHVNFITSVTLFIHIFQIIYVNHYFNHYFTIFRGENLTTRHYLDCALPRPVLLTA